MLPFMDRLLHGSPEMPNMVKVHVTYDETKRFVSYQKADDDEFNDYVELQNDERVEDHINIRALISKPVKEAARWFSSEAESEIKPHWPHCHWVIPWYPLFDTNNLVPIGPRMPIFQRPHQIKKNTTYRLWSPVSRQKDSLIQRDPTTNIVNCSGSFSEGFNTVVMAIDETSQRPFFVGLTFRDTVAPKDAYAITGNGLGKDITATKIHSGGGPLDDKSVFEPLYFWSYTMFRNKFYHNPQLYLGCDNTGKTTLVENVDLDYPNPQALFILNKFN
ncbi:hypothetical protein ACROYT_G037223 [Oculina patagonica]